MENKTTPIDSLVGMSFIEPGTRKVFSHKVNQARVMGFCGVRKRLRRRNRNTDRMVRSFDRSFK